MLLYVLIGMLLIAVIVIAAMLSNGSGLTGSLTNVGNITDTRLSIPPEIKTTTTVDPKLSIPPEIKTTTTIDPKLSIPPEFKVAPVTTTTVQP